MSAVEVKADGQVTVQTATPEFDVEDVDASGTVSIWTSTPEFVTYEVAG